MMITATTAPGKALLNANDHTLILIDYQPQMAFATASVDGVTLRNNVAIVANAAKAFAVSTILTTVSAESFSGPIVDEVRSALPSLKIIDRTSMNCWEDAAVVAEINRLGKSRIVIGGLWTSRLRCRSGAVGPGSGLRRLCHHQHLRGYLRGGPSTRYRAHAAGRRAADDGIAIPA